MTQMCYKYQDEKDRVSCIYFLKHSGFWNDIEVDSERSVTHRLIISIDDDEADNFNVRAKYKGFNFNEIDT